MTSWFSSLHCGAAPSILTIALVVLTFALSYYSGDVNPEILDTQVSLLRLESTELQRLSYVLILLAFVAYAVHLLLQGSGPTLHADCERSTVLFLAAVAVAFLLGKHSTRQAVAFLLIMGTFVTYRERDGVQTRVDRVFCYVRSNWPLVSTVLWVAIAVTVMALWISPFFTPLVAENPREFRVIDGHYAVTVLGGYNLFASEDSETGRAYYGMGMPLLISAFFHVAQRLDVSGVGLPDAVKFYQLFALAIAALILYTINRTRASLTITLLIALTAYTLSGVGFGVGYPNQSGVRYVPVLLGLLMFAAELRRSDPRPWMMAIIAAVSTIFSPGTGIALTSGLATAAVLHRYDHTRPVASTVRSFGGFVLTFGAAFATLYAVFVSIVFSGSQVHLAEFLGLFGVTGYGGLVARPSFGAGMLFLFCTSLLLVIVSKARASQLDNGDLWQAALATFILIWMYYYINRMSEWNLWFHWLLFVLLVAPQLDFARARLAHLRRPGFRTHYHAALVATLISQGVVGIHDAYERTRNWAEDFVSGCADLEPFSGVCIPAHEGRAIASQLQVLDEFDPDDTFVLTGFPTAVKLRGFNRGLPLASPMEIVLRSDLPKFARWIDAHGRRFLLIDGPESVVTSVAPQHTEQAWRYISRLRNYVEKGRRGGWVVFERTVPEVGP